MKHNYKKSGLLAAVAVSSLLFMNYSTGPGGGGLRVTGAPFDNGTCNSCHSGGSFAATLSLQLIKQSTGLAVTSYATNAQYWVRISRTANATLPANGGWGFQLTAATSPTNTNNNTWGLTLPANTIKRTNASRNYIEHTTKLNKTLASVDIPWTAPATNVGDMKFYVAMNTVNGNGGSNGDQVLSTSLTINGSALPISWLYFRGNEDKGHVALEWGTASEKNNSHFTIERSRDGISFTTIGTLEASNAETVENKYSFVDLQPMMHNYYRISQTDLDGNQNYFKTIEVATSKDYIAPYVTLSASDIFLYMQHDASENAVLKIWSMDGKEVSSQNVILQAGANSIHTVRPQVPGMYLISISSGNTILYHQKIAAF